ncbi:MAG: hypothetical protein HY741_27245, partial [Chloroflexi bacterium]|nr:hypothetical protein [Chloroflexota bacterium]
TIGPDLTFNGGTYDAFVAKVAEICAVSKPRLLSPENGAPVTAQRVSLKWKAAKCAEWYNVVVTRDSPKGRTVYQESNLTTRQVKTKKLARGKTYFWQVEACNAVGCTLSKRWKFTISATAATEALNRDD